MVLVVAEATFSELALATSRPQEVPRARFKVWNMHVDA